MSKFKDKENIIFDLNDIPIVKMADVEAGLLATCERTNEKYGAIFLRLIMSTYLTMNFTLLFIKFLSTSTKYLAAM